MSVSVVIATRNRSEWLQWAISSLCDQEVPPAEIVIVDGSDPAHAVKTESVVKACRERFPGIIYQTSPPGHTRQKNVGVAHASQEILLFMDDDVVLHPSYLGVVLRTFERDSEIVGVGGRIWNETERSPMATAFRRFFTMADNKRGDLTASADAGHIYQVESTAEVQTLSGSNMAFRRSLFRDGGLSFDENFEGYGLMEDQIFSLQAGTKGRLVQNGDAILFHGFRPRDRWSERYARDQACRAAYVYVTIGRHRGGRLTALIWRLVGRTLYGVASGLAHKRMDVVRGALGGFAHVIKHFPEADENPAIFLSPGTRPPESPTSAEKAPVPTVTRRPGRSA